MAYLPEAKSPDEIKEIGVAQTRKEYNTLAGYYTKIVNQEYVYCPKCGKFQSRNAYYSDSRFANGYFPICKDCLLQMVEQRKNKNDESHESKGTVKEVLRLLDLPYIDSLYKSRVASVENDTAERKKSSPFITMVVQLKSLPQYSGMKWIDSDVDEYEGDGEDELKLNQRLITDGKKNFGRGFSNEDYMYLEAQYEDWLKRYEINTKTQEVLFQRLCCKQLDAHKMQIQGKDTKDVDKTIQEIMASLNVKPSQSNADALTSSKVFGELIKIWEAEKPIPEPQGIFNDIDRIGLYIDVFFKGHLAVMMGLKNAFSSIYERYIAKYTVTKPQYTEDDDNETILNNIFADTMDMEEAEDAYDGTEADD